MASPRPAWELRNMAERFSSTHGIAKPCGNAALPLPLWEPTRLSRLDLCGRHGRGESTGRNLDSSWSAEPRGRSCRDQGDDRELLSIAHQICAPGSLDGGDVCEAEGHFFIGLSKRTNEEGARQLATHLTDQGYTCSLVDVRGMTSILHLKSAISWIGNRTFVATEEMAENTVFAGYEFIRVLAEESNAANCVRVNHRVLVAAGNPRLTADLVEHGFNPLVLDISEFRKMDGGLSCLSLRF